MIGEIRQNFTEASASVGLILATALATAKKPFSKLRATTDIFPSVAVHTYVTCMPQLPKCSYVVTATFLDHDKVQKTDLLRCALKTTAACKK